jgi:hypothetical protein
MTRADLDGMALKRAMAIQRRTRPLGLFRQILTLVVSQ